MLSLAAVCIFVSSLRGFACLIVLFILEDPLAANFSLVHGFVEITVQTYRACIRLFVSHLLCSDVSKQDYLPVSHSEGEYEQCDGRWCR